MRRKEFQVEDAEAIQFLNEMTYGTLGTMGEDQCPNLKPVNFVYFDNHIYFHGSRGGEKIKDVKREEKASFIVSHEYAIIPSTFTEAEIACPATSFFKSVSMRGEVKLMDDYALKSKALSLFMKKLQPEGGYRPFELDDAEYIKNIRATAVFQFKIQSLVAKFKFGQNMKETPRNQIMDNLQARGSEMDMETRRLMEKYCPAHKKQTAPSEKMTA